MKHDTTITWSNRSAKSLDLKGTNAAVIGGTGGIGRAISRALAARGATVTVVGRKFLDSGLPRIEFLHADLTLMSDAARTADALAAKDIDLLVMTTGIMAAPAREVTAEGLERDLAVSFLNRLVMLRRVAPQLGAARDGKARVFVFGFPGDGQKGNLEDFNSEFAYKPIPAHMNTVAGNEALVLDAAARYPNLAVFGLNPGIMKTDIRSNFLGAGSVKHRMAEALIGTLGASVDDYAERIVPLLTAPGLDKHSGTMFDRKGRAIAKSSVMTSNHAAEVIAASESLVARVAPGVSFPVA